MGCVLIGYEAKVQNPFVGKKPRHKKDPEKTQDL